jgi:hypothetical protein
MNLNEQCNELAVSAMTICTLSTKFQPTDAYQDHVAVRKLADKIIALRANEVREQAGQEVRS